jgi:hypothetical protein
MDPQVRVWSSAVRGRQAWCRAPRRSPCLPCCGPELRLWRWRDSNPRPSACKAGALPTELHPRVDLRFCVAPRFVHGSTALQQHPNSSARLDGVGAVGGGGIGTVGRERSRLYPSSRAQAERMAVPRRLRVERRAAGSGSKCYRGACLRMPWEHGGWARSVHWREERISLLRFGYRTAQVRHGPPQRAGRAGHGRPSDGLKRDRFKDHRPERSHRVRNRSPHVRGP